MIHRVTLDFLTRLSWEAAETRRTEHSGSRQREDGVFFLARPALQRQRERNVGPDDRGAGQPPGVTGQLITNCQ